MKINRLMLSSRFSKKKRLGRGIGSGRGKTCARGVKGQKSRSGVSVAFLEGGQQQFAKALPKRGFRPLERESYIIVSVAQIKSWIELGFVKKDELLTKDMLIKLSKSKKKSQPLKILSSACDFPYNSFRCEYDKISLSALKKLGLKAS